MPISQKQKQILAFPFTHYDALICDGAIRSGKTAFMTIAFIDDAMRRYNGQRFGICGKTIGSAKKNIIAPYRGIRYSREKYDIKWRASENEMVVSNGKRENVFEVFGGKDERSYALIQGRTLAGVLLDEVALQPQSFVEQALGRCSVEDSRFWFNCNPDCPQHWFYKDWICDLKKHNAIRLHFLLEDNPSLSPKKIEQYHNTYSGLFYRRYILGEWVQAEGLIYPMFSHDKHVVKSKPRNYSTYYVSCDYGTTNPMSMGLWGFYNNQWYRVADSYFDSKKEQKQRTDEEHYRELEKLICKNIPADNPFARVIAVIVDPSAASFIQTIKRHGRLKVIPGNNDVKEGIANVSSALNLKKLVFCDCCHDIFDEFVSYVWDEKASLNGDDKPVKQHDHAMDDMRYFVNTVLYHHGGLRIGGV